MILLETGFEGLQWIVGGIALGALLIGLVYVLIFGQSTPHS